MIDILLTSNYYYYFQAKAWTDIKYFTDIFDIHIWKFVYEKNTLKSNTYEWEIIGPKWSFIFHCLYAPSLGQCNSKLSYKLPSLICYFFKYHVPSERNFFVFTSSELPCICRKYSGLPLLYSLFWNLEFFII